MIRATPLVDALSAATPFVGPETLARAAGFDIGEVIRLGANESAYGPSPYALAAMTRQLSRVNDYGDPENHDLREALASHIGCTRGELLVGSGIDDLIALFLRAFVAPGETVLATAGTYATFFYHAAACGAKVATVPYRERRPDVDGLIAAMTTSKPRLVYLANPDNPSGAFLDAESLTRLERALPDQTLLMLDEAYAEYVDASALLDGKTRGNVLRLRTFSKVYGLAGLRVGYAIAAREIIGAGEKIRQHFGVNRPAQAAAEAALEQPTFVTTVVRDTAVGKLDYKDLAEDAGLTVYPSSTNFVLFELGSRARAEALVRELFDRHVFIRKPGPGPFETCVRITVGTRALRDYLRPPFLEAVEACRQRPPV